MQKIWKNPLAIVICGGTIMGLALGARHVQGLFLLPMTQAHGWSREEFAFAIALQNLVWGFSTPFTGMIADKFGAVKVLLAGCLLYAVGLFLMSGAASTTGLVFSAGILIGFAQSGTTFAVVYGALSRIVAPERRGWALGLAGAMGGLGQFAMVPAAQGFLAQFGWVAALTIFAFFLAAASPLAFALADPHTGSQADQHGQSLREAIVEAVSHRGFWLLNFGFLACGFQLAFIAGHLPAYLLDKGLAGRSAVLALSLIALANIGGTYVFGLLGARYRRKHLLAYLYLARSLVMAGYVLLPLSEASTYVFAFLIGLLWLGTVPLTNGIVAQVFGVKYLSTLFGLVFVGHQIGSFFGVWLGGKVFDATGSYNGLWLGSIVLGVVAAALHWPIDDRQVLRLRPA